MTQNDLSRAVKRHDSLNSVEGKRQDFGRDIEISVRPFPDRPCSWQVETRSHVMLRNGRFSRGRLHFLRVHHLDVQKIYRHCHRIFTAFPTLVAALPTDEFPPILDTNTIRNAAPNPTSATLTHRERLVR